jgi:predicted transcriptional regulator of viral defense system
VERLSRGLYRLTDSKPLGNPDLVAVSKRVPGGVVCLISALSFYDLTDEIPHAVDVAVSRNAEPPRVDYPPIRAFRFSAEAFTEGVTIHMIDAVEVRIYSPEKTLADCFKFRNKIGLDTVKDALRRYKESRRVQVEPLLHFAGICRVARVMRPYLEAIL